MSGPLLALGAFLLLPIGDAMVKSMAGHWPGTAISVLRYVFGLMALTVLLWRNEGRNGFACPRPRLQFARGCAMTLTILSFFAGVQLMPLAEMTAISFTGPIITAILSAMILKEPMSRASWLATLIAFPGVLLILRPNVADLGWAAILPLTSALGFALTIIFNRMAAGLGSALQMQFLVVSFAFPLVLLVTVAGHMSGIDRLAVPIPNALIVAKCAGVAFTGTLSHWLLFKATEIASPPTVAPFTYSQLLMATMLGAVFFGDWPDGASLLGAALIIGAGLYLWWKS